MAEETVPEIPKATEEITTEDKMELESPNETTEQKRPREEEEDNGTDVENGKKQKVEKSVEEERLEKKEGGEGEEKKEGPVSIGPKVFNTSAEMFDYFYNFLHYWPTNIDINKYEHMALLDLLKKGHTEPDTKIGGGIHAFQIRNHPMWKSKCFFLVRVDDSVEDFSFRKCVDQILPLPEEMKLKPDADKVLGGRGGRGGHGHGGRWGGGRRGGRGRGRGGGFRN